MKKITLLFVLIGMVMPFCMHAKSIIIVDEPLIAAIIPSSGCPGSQVVITGANFTAVQQVLIGGNAVTSFTVNSGTQITTIVNSSSTGSVTVVTANGTAVSVTEFTVTNVPAPAIQDDGPIFCYGATVGDLENNGNYLWYDVETGGEPLETNLLLIGEDIYYVSQLLNGCESEERTTVYVHINSVEPPTGDAVQQFCNVGTIGDLYAEGAAIWYDAPVGGNVLPGNYPLVNLETYYASQIFDGCESISRFAVEVIISAAYVDELPDVEVCTQFILPELEFGDYYTDQGGAGFMLNAGTAITESAELYIFGYTSPNPNCSAESSFMVTVLDIPAPTGDASQLIEIDEGGIATIENLEATGSGTISWYISEEDALSGTNPLPAGTVLVSGTTYYASQMMDGCTSTEVLAVTAAIVLGEKSFDAHSFSFYPNPVTDVLNLTSSSEITLITIFNVLGQIVMEGKPNSAEVKLDMSALEEGIYLLYIQSNTVFKIIKILKR